MDLQNVVIIGSGNVATCMGKALKAAGIAIVAVYSPTPAHAEELAVKLGSRQAGSFSEIPSDAGLYILAVKDEAIKQASDALGEVSGIVVHTSGSTSIEVLSRHKHHGVFYALQTFKKGQQPDFSHIPFLIEASDGESEHALAALAGKLSNDVRTASSLQRQSLHVAAVFANNFTNHMYAIAKQILEKQGLPFELLVPLIRQTAENAAHSDPVKVQTGPVVRNDMNIIEMHLGLLETAPELRQIYELISRSIAVMQHNASDKTE